MLPWKEEFWNVSRALFRDILGIDSGFGFCRRHNENSTTNEQPQYGRIAIPFFVLRFSSEFSFHNICHKCTVVWQHPFPLLIVHCMSSPLCRTPPRDNFSQRTVRSPLIINSSPFCQPLGLWLRSSSGLSARRAPSPAFAPSYEPDSEPPR